MIAAPTPRSDRLLSRPAIAAPSTAVGSRLVDPLCALGPAPSDVTRSAYGAIGLLHQVAAPRVERVGAAAQ
jgi:hypothetical protein